MLFSGAVLLNYYVWERGMDKWLHHLKCYYGPINNDLDITWANTGTVQGHIF